MNPIVSRVFVNRADAEEAAAAVGKIGIPSRNVTIVAAETHRQQGASSGAAVEPQTSAAASQFAGGQVDNSASGISSGDVHAAERRTGLVEEMGAAGVSSTDAEAYSNTVRDGAVLVAVRADRENEDSVRAELDRLGSLEGAAAQAVDQA